MFCFVLNAVLVDPNIATDVASVVIGVNFDDDHALGIAVIREYMTRGIVEGVILLGDREIKKWPESSNAVRNYLLNQ